MEPEEWAQIFDNFITITQSNKDSSKTKMNASQKSDINTIFDGWKNAGNLDYVSAWYKKTADFALGKNLRAAFVSTNSICQGDSIATLRRPLFDNVHIDFAHRTFRWDSESTQKVHVHKPIDDGNYLFTFDEMIDFIKREPAAEKFFRKWYGAREFINNEPCYCILLKDCPPNELKKMKLVYERVKNVREFRLASKSTGIRNACR